MKIKFSLSLFFKILFIRIKLHGYCRGKFSQSEKKDELKLLNIKAKIWIKMIFDLFQQHSWSETFSNLPSFSICKPIFMHFWLLNLFSSLTDSKNIIPFNYFLRSSTNFQSLISLVFLASKTFQNSPLGINVKRIRWSSDQSRRKTFSGV